MPEIGEIKDLTLCASKYGCILYVPVEILNIDVKTKDNRVVSVDFCVKKQTTTTIIESTGDELKQIAPPQFLDHESKQKLLRLKSKSESLKDRLAELQDDIKGQTKRFKHLQSEYESKRTKER
jgi:hypothetical protein